jgi:hypothetical protein
MKQLEEIFQSRVLAMLKRKGRIADELIRKLLGLAAQLIECVYWKPYSQGRQGRSGGAGSIYHRALR